MEICRYARGVRGRRPAGVGPHENEGDWGGRGRHAGSRGVRSMRNVARPEPIPRGLRGAESGWVTPGRRGGQDTSFPGRGHSIPKCRNANQAGRRRGATSSALCRMSPKWPLGQPSRAAVPKPTVQPIALAGFWRREWTVPTSGAGIDGRRQLWHCGGPRPERHGSCNRGHGLALPHGLTRSPESSDIGHIRPVRGASSARNDV